jgi:hypothetical protein
MRKLPRLLILAAAIAPLPAQARGGHLCLPFTRNYAFLRELPEGAAAALGFPIAERGARWNATDVVRPGPMLPFARFISAQGGGCSLTVRYEHGGIDHSEQTATLVRDEHGWHLARRQ